MFERFTDKARHAVTLAQEEARKLDHNYIGTEHLLLGLSAVEDSIAAKVLRSSGVDADTARHEVESRVGRGPEVPRGHIPFTPLAKRALEVSLREALTFGHNYIGTEHLLLGLMRVKDGVAAQVLTDKGLTLDDARKQIIVLLQERGVEVAAAGGGRDTAAVFAAAARRRGKRKLVPAGEPLCSHCQGSLAQTAAYKIIEVREKDGDGVAQVLLLFCSACGHTLDDVILPGE